MTRTAQQLMEIYAAMRRIRAFEEMVVQAYGAGEIPGVVHPYIGEEAVAVGVCSALRPGDRIISHHRGHGHVIAKGGDFKRMVAELYGKKTGYCQGRGGSMHIADFGIGMLGANGILGSGMAIAAGAALGAQLQGQGQVVVSFFGDGAAQEGVFHEVLNIAALWKLPLIFACENNLYAVNMPIAEALANPHVSELARSYGMPGQEVDGQDVVAVADAADRAVERARQRHGPTFLECKTYRFLPHIADRPGFPMPDTRPQEEKEAWRRRDPVLLLERKLLAEELLRQADIERIGREVHGALEEAVAFAKGSPLPTVEEVLSGVFAPSKA